MEEEEKKGFWTEKKVFWVRLIAWITFAVILPVLFIIFRFDVFGGSKLAIGFWGFVVIGIILAFIISMLRYVCKAMPYSMTAQCISGLGRVILPLVIIWIAAWVIRNNLDVFLQSLGVVIASEAVAIPLNPMPKWIHTHLSEEQQKKISNLSDIVWDKYFSRKSKDE